MAFTDGGRSSYSSSSRLVSVMQTPSLPFNFLGSKEFILVGLILKELTRWYAGPPVSLAVTITGDCLMFEFYKFVAVNCKPVVCREIWFAVSCFVIRDWSPLVDMSCCFEKY